MNKAASITIAIIAPIIAIVVIIITRMIIRSCYNGKIYYSHLQYHVATYFDCKDTRKVVALRSNNYSNNNNNSTPLALHDLRQVASAIRQRTKSLRTPLHNKLFGATPYTSEVIAYDFAREKLSTINGSLKRATDLDPSKRILITIQST